MKNATATGSAFGSCYYRMCSTDVYCSKQTGSSSTKGNHQPVISSSFLNWAEEKLSMQPKFARCNVVKTETQQTFVNGLLGFITRHLYLAGSRRGLLTIIV